MSKQIDIAAEIGLTDSESSTPTATSPINVPPTPPDEETVARANSLKDQGNKFLTTGRYSQAAEKYSEAIALYPNAIYYSNRAQALIKLEAYGQAIADANEAIRLDPKYIKAYYRRASANYALGKLKAALKDFKSVLTIVPKDPDAAAKAKLCEKILREDAFQKAIEMDAPIESTIDVDDVQVDNSYHGPRLEKDAPVTMDFVQDCIEHFRAEKLLHRKYVMMLLLRGIELFKSLPTLLSVPLPRDQTGAVCGTLTVCGDTHGQYYDLLNIFELGGFPSENNVFFFNGDYVDRGSFSFETVFALLLIKLANPSAVHMLRGNHETKNMNRIYGFEGEVKHKYDDNVMKLFTKLFQCLPLAAVLENKVFVVHGGLSTNGTTYGEGDSLPSVLLGEIGALDRFREPPERGLMSDLLWSDPQPQLGREASKRGLGFSFGPDYTNAFLKRNNLQLVIRSHEVRDEGYEVEHGGKVITVFSAPNYCDQMGNKGAYIRFGSEDMVPAFTKFVAAPHPNIPPMRYAGNMFSL